MIYVNTDIGTLQVEYLDNCIHAISKVGERTESILTDSFAKAIKSQFVEYFDGTRKSFDLPFNLVGTEFQKKVWGELLKIPYGETITYAELAQRVGTPKACRAVGNANGKNKILIVVPCHRVVAKNNIGGFACGVNTKKILLELEKRN